MRTFFDHVSRDATDGVFPVCDVPSRKVDDVLGAGLVRARAPRIPNLSEGDVARHYTQLSKLNYGVDDGIYPLGSCTMKYNPKLNEDVARLPGLADVHPRADEALVQGSLGLLYDLSELLRGISGLAVVTLQPVAGAASQNDSG